jgi:hypothetical protein
VDGPSIEELRQRMEAASGGADADQGRVAPANGHVDLHATTEPPSSDQSREEVFFVRDAPARDPGATIIPPEQAALAPSPPPSTVRDVSTATRAGAHDVTVPDPIPRIAIADPPWSADSQARSAAPSEPPRPVLAQHQPSNKPVAQSPAASMYGPARVVAGPVTSLDRRSVKLYLDPAEAYRLLAPEVPAHVAARNSDLPGHRAEAPRPSAQYPYGPPTDPARRGAYVTPSGAQGLSHSWFRSNPGAQPRSNDRHRSGGVRAAVLLGIGLAATLSIALTVFVALLRRPHQPPLPPAADPAAGALVSAVVEPSSASATSAPLSNTAQAAPEPASLTQSAASSSAPRVTPPTRPPPSAARPTATRPLDDVRDPFVH